MIDNAGSIQLCECCFDVCEALGTAIQGKDVNGLNQTVRTTLEGFERCVGRSQPRLQTVSIKSRVVCEIERTVRKGVVTPQYSKKVEEHRLEILRILDSQGSPPDERLRVIHGPIPPVPVASGDTAATPVAESGTFSVPWDTNHTPIRSPLSTSIL